MSGYLAGERPITEDEFTRLACDPRSSAIVEACAGSGKTWLLVSRIIRCLLDGVAPGEILAITFTRQAAQEMRSRLLSDLQSLAVADENDAIRMLVERGVDADSARGQLGSARNLYESALTAAVPITIETFHGWFWQLLARAPLGAGVPFAPVLLEAIDRMQADAWLQFSAALIEPEHVAERRAWELMIDEIGDVSARKLLDEFLDKRAEWWSFAADDDSTAVERSLAPMQCAEDVDPCSRIRSPEFVEAVATLADAWRSIPRSGVRIADAVALASDWIAADHRDADLDFRSACRIVLTQKDTPTIWMLPDEVRARLSPASMAHYSRAHALVIEFIDRIRAERRTWRAWRLNRAGLVCGRLYVDIYQRLKEQESALDFTDLEWHAHRLLSDPDNAAYMHARLDARYRQILLDEFQDTNPLQWQVLQSWLASYGELDVDLFTPLADRPCVFVVGDPKQSIYRFRRADPRVFAAAIERLGRDFAATHLRTNVTRRNASELIDVLNRTMAGRNPLFQEQSTTADEDGTYIVLPVARPGATLAEPRLPSGLRDVLSTPRPARDTDVRYREGRALANEIAAARARLRVREGDTERSARWSDVLLLVRRRRYLLEYERALRDAGIPFVSDRRGGLLATLEADDLIALLEFLVAPYSDLRLAHALRSPVFGCSDEDLVLLAMIGRGSWWSRLRSTAVDGSPRLVRARTLLQGWITRAGILPVHDLLDQIYFEGELRTRYGAIVPAAVHPQVQANLDAFIALALELDSGRFPSLSRFIDELKELRRHATEDAPDEGAPYGTDAVRVMTIHGAKGLEAEIVALADAQASEKPDAERVLIVWPPQNSAPTHFSLVGHGARHIDPGRTAWFESEDEQRVQEDWNLLYVAATRARRVLIVSGSEATREADTWYSRLQSAAELSRPPSPPQPVNVGSRERRVFDFRPAPLGVGVRSAPAFESELMRMGSAWHALLERGPEADVPAVARVHGLDEEQTETVVVAAERVRSRLPHLFAGRAHAELDIVSPSGDLMRVDRIVETDDALWIIDFKWRVTDAERPEYEAQVRRYGELLRAIRDRPVRLALVSADGAFTEVPSGIVEEATSRK